MIGEPRTAEERRALGALIGLAVGDALGTTNEFKPKGSFTPLTDMVGGGPFHLPRGAWTDDTSMALCLAESLLECRRFDATDQINRYVRWWRHGENSSTGRCFDIGITVRNALSHFQKTGEPFAGSTDPMTAGNGSLMRLAPVAVYYRATPAVAIRMAGESSRTTHQATEAIDACRYFAGLLIGAIAGVPKDDLLSPSYARVEGVWDREPLCEGVARIADGSWRGKSANELPASGYVLHTLEAALWAFATTEDFRTGALVAVNLGGDADTTGAVYGQLAGAYYGIDGIPADWVAHLARREALERLETLALRSHDGMEIQ